MGQTEMEHHPECPYDRGGPCGCASIVWSEKQERGDVKYHADKEGRLTP